MQIPNGHTRVMPYLIVKNAAGFLSFTEKVFGAVSTNKVMRENTDKIMHAEIDIHGGTVMFAEATDEFLPAAAQMFIYVDNADETYATALANGGKSVMELSDQNYGRTCGVADAWGNTWWITSL